MDESKVKEKFPLHFCIWNNDYKTLNDILQNDKSAINSSDCRGRTPLMLSIRLGHIESTRVLLQHEVDATTLSNHNWSASNESVITCDRQLIKLVMTYRDAQMVCQQSKQINEFMQLLTKADNYYLEMKWNFGSWLPLVEKMCPFDKCCIYKSGNNLRVDTTLCGISPNGTWLKGNFTYIVNIKDNEVTVDEVNHSTFTVYRRIFKKELENSDLNAVSPSDEVVAYKMNLPIFVTYLEDKNILWEKSKSTKPLKWLNERKESINNCECNVYSAQIVHVVTLRRTEHLPDTEKCKYREHGKSGSTSGDAKNDVLSGNTLNSTNDADRLIKADRFNPDSVKVEEYFNKDFNMQLRDIGRRTEMTSRTKTYKTHAWLCHDFPLKFDTQVLPVIKLMALYNVQFKRMLEYMEKSKFPDAGFPMKIEVPLYNILSSLVTFGNVHGQEQKVEHVLCQGAKGDASSCSLKSAQCQIDESVFIVPSVYKLIVENSPCRGLEEEEQLLQAALLNRLIDHGATHPDKAALSQARKSSLASNAYQYYGEEDAMLQRAIEESLVMDGPPPADIPGDKSSGPDPTDHQVKSVLEMSKKADDEERRQREAEEQEFQRILELSKNDK